MAFASIDTRAPSTAASRGGLRTLFTRFGQWRLYRHTLSELRELDARELNDLGLTRADLRRAAHQAVYGEGAPYARG
jgi:uncharacterized protein YjiS (DUF1127 family)